MPVPSHKIALAAASLAAAVLFTGGCSQHTPEAYHRERPSVNELDSRDKGLQSADVVQASDTLAMKLLALDEVRGAPRKLTVVFTRLDDQTRTHDFDYNIFLERLKTNIGAQGRDKVAIVRNRDEFYKTRNRELDPVRLSERDAAATGRTTGPRPANRTQPDFEMTGKVMELRRQGTSYYLFTFTLVDISDTGGTEIPLSWEVKVAH